jgi:hypothetical protein
MSLTKAILLKKAAVKKPDVLGEFFGETVYVKSVSELQRSRRMASLYDMKKEKMRDEALLRARCATIVDHVCDKDGKPLFTDKDMNDLMELDAILMDQLIHAIEEWVASREGKQAGK